LGRIPNNSGNHWNSRNEGRISFAKNGELIFLLKIIPTNQAYNTLYVYKYNKTTNSMTQINIIDETNIQISNENYFNTPFLVSSSGELVIHHSHRFDNKKYIKDYNSTDLYLNLGP